MNSRGKKILDIEWKREGLDIKVPVKAYDRTAFSTVEYETREGKIMKFRAEFPEAGIDIEDTDINKVRKQVLDALDAWYTVKWELYFMVEISGGRSGQEGGEHKVEFEMEFYVLGQDCRGNKRHMRIPRPKPDQIEDFNGKFTRWSGQSPQDGELHVGEKISGHFSSKSTRSLVKATTENVAAADQFMVAMESLLEKMHYHFSPHRIEKLLKNTALLLPAPK